MQIKTLILIHLFFVILLCVIAALNLFLTAGILSYAPANDAAFPETVWDEEKWARKAIAFDGNDTIDRVTMTLYKDAMAQADQRCLEDRAVLDELIEMSLWHDAQAGAGARLQILYDFGRLEGIHDCSAILARN